MVFTIIEPLTAPLEAFLNSAIMLFPNLIAAVILLAIGWVIGVIVGRIVKELMLRFKIDQYISKRGPMLKLSDIFPIVFEWVIYLVFIQAAVHAIGIEPLENFVGTIVDFLPGLIGAIILVIVGYIIAGYVKRQVEKTKIAYSNMMANILFWLMVYLSFALALPLIQIDTTIINYLLLITVASLGIGFAIAIGLGLKDVVKDIATKKLKEMRKKKK